MRAAIERGDALVEEVKRDGRVEHQAYGVQELVKALGVRPGGVTESQRKARLERVRFALDPEEPTFYFGAFG
jgi:hypothetical protein